MNAFLTLLCHDIRLQARQKSAWAMLVLFFIIVVILTPFALGPELEILRRLSPGLIWFAALLMSLLSLEHLFVQDARDGTLDEMLLAPLPLEIIVLARLCAQIFVMLVLLLLALGPAALLLDMNMRALPVLLISFALGIPALIFLGGIVGAITVALPRNAALLTLLLAPFYIAILIFAVGACDAAANGSNPLQPTLFLAAFPALILPTAPFIIAASLRYAQE